jgi:hypothetical protein
LALGALVAALGAAAVAAGVIVLTGGSSGSTASKSSTNASLVNHATRPATAVVPSTVTVAVLNGTDIFHLADHISQQLTADGFRKGSVNNASNQTQTTTVVAYMTPADKPDALAVATSLKLGRSAVQLIDASTKAIACPPGQACPSRVVVTVGKDLAAQ